MDLQTQQVDFDEVPEGFGAIGVMGPDGDTKHLWDPKKPAEVEAARVLFESLVAQGYRAFRLTTLRQKGKKLRKFDPKAGKVVFVAPKEEAGAKDAYRTAHVDGEIMDSFEPEVAQNVLFTRPFAGG